MEKQRYQLSPNLHIISDLESETAMVYHTLYGNPRIVNEEGLRFLNFFRQPTTIEEISKVCDGDPGDNIREFAEIIFLVELGFDEKKFLREKKEQQLAQVQERRTVDRMGLAITFGKNGGLMQIVDNRFPGTDEYCSRCIIKGLCGGQCHVTREVVFRSRGEERQKLFVNMCDFYREITKVLAVEYIRSNGIAAVGNRQTCTL